MAYTPTVWTDGTGVPLSAANLNHIEQGIAAINQTAFNVKSYGATGDGVTDDTAAVTAAATAMVNNGRGVLYFPAGKYKVTALPNLVPPVATGPLTYAVRGDGSAVTIILHYGTSAGASLTASNPLFNVNNASFGAPEWHGFTIDGTNSSGGCSGIRWGDISYGSYSDIVCSNFTTGDGFTFMNGYGWTEGFGIAGCQLNSNLNAVRFDVGSGAQIGVVTTAIASGAVFTSIAVAGGTNQALFSGQQIVLAANTSAPGVIVQTVTTSAAVAAGAVSIPIVSATATTTYPAGTAQFYKGSYGSFDYWSVRQLYVSVGPNQNGIVSEVSRGLGANIDRQGTSWRMTGNFGAGSTNTGVLLWLKGRDNWDNVQWDVSVEVDGTGTVHKSIQLDTTTSYVGGNGRFVAYFFGALSAQSYQIGISGRVALNGYVDNTGGNMIVTSTPIARAVKSSVAPSGGANGFSAYLAVAPTSGTSYQNLTGKDLFVTIMITATAANATAGWNVDTYSGLPAGSNVFAGVPSGMTFPLTFVHYHGSWAKVTFANATAAAPIFRYV